LEGEKMILYSTKLHRHVERKIHFGVGQSVKTACGLVKFSRHVMVSAFSDNDGSIITENIDKVTCKRCLAMKDTKLRKLMAIQAITPGIFDRDFIVDEKWLMEHALNISRESIDSQKLELLGTGITLSNRISSKDRKIILEDVIKRR
jgi:hypothetical protein